ncbi:IMP cyclohydrolase / phosphoribosylaminoimidazolecarboxamide formyltransferase [Salinispira pacifica]|uniref:IMP cyclohydrolase/ Phosphoribosylaminoimidazolecarboxamide formyltransferase n=1 Tax=Salinispira pacifica TaxID=1307761 RepID=V5WHB5_9SPIO|nr:IMP cyclohydrolase / phosphoribosylaminoimidazolecarboxamide formyltransferase [Salinispira pacifica]AHC15227.1 IMP cyclohydrolase/ Phosphoribosylaminoimidazolecarboxamide formyltransferase [Salinispira pacifica]
MNIVQKVPDQIKIRNALISVSDKTGIRELVRGLVRHGVNIYSTGGTFRTIQEELGDFDGGIHSDKLHSVSSYTGQPEMQGGLVKTLDYRIYLGLLSEPYNSDHREDMKRTQSIDFDMVVVNLYPFSQQISRKESTMESARSHIDIGGPTMLRASAKNYIRVASVCNPESYEEILSSMDKGDGSLNLEMRFSLARRSFEHTAGYDQAISSYLAGCSTDQLPSVYHISGEEWR